MSTFLTKLGQIIGKKHQKKTDPVHLEAVKNVKTISQIGPSIAPQRQSSNLRHPAKTLRMFFVPKGLKISW